ncbi:MAG: Asp23/Gls24 family envelope stress response protein [Clostridia bacterium]|nr:Asp23/Gls24 family envelope stress response protein [Clostridia bacterium]
MAEIKNDDFSGGLVISEEVIASIAMNAAEDVEGVSSFALRPTDVQTVFKIGGESLKHVKVTIVDNEIKLHLYINIASNAKIPIVCASVQQAVKNAVQSMTGKMVTKVNVSVAGIDFNEPTELQK